MRRRQNLQCTRSFLLFLLSKRNQEALTLSPSAVSSGHEMLQPRKKLSPSLHGSVAGRGGQRPANTEANRGCGAVHTCARASVLGCVGLHARVRGVLERLSEAYRRRTATSPLWPFPGEARSLIYKPFQPGPRPGRPAQSRG